jgi:hypothetical protein
MVPEFCDFFHDDLLLAARVTLLNREARFVV